MRPRLVDLLRNLFGNLTSGIIRLAVFAGMLLLLYLLIVKPVLKTTNDAIHSTGLDQIGKSLEGDRPRSNARSHRGESRVPLQRGHQTRWRSRTFHRVPQREHTWIIRPA